MQRGLLLACAAGVLYAASINVVRRSRPINSPLYASPLPPINTKSRLYPCPNSCANADRNPYYLGPLWNSNLLNSNNIAYGQAYANIQCDSCTSSNVTCKLCVVVVVNKDPTTL